MPRKGVCASTGLMSRGMAANYDSVCPKLNSVVTSMRQSATRNLQRRPLVASIPRSLIRFLRVFRFNPNTSAART